MHELSLSNNFLGIHQKLQYGKLWNALVERTYARFLKIKLQEWESWKWEVWEVPMLNCPCPTIQYTGNSWKVWIWGCWIVINQHDLGIHKIKGEVCIPSAIYHNFLANFRTYPILNWKENWRRIFINVILMYTKCSPHGITNFQPRISNLRNYLLLLLYFGKTIWFIDILWRTFMASKLGIREIIWWAPQIDK